jgi:hypothetical protein
MQEGDQLGVGEAEVALTSTLGGELLRATACLRTNVRAPGSRRHGRPTTCVAVGSVLDIRHYLNLVLVTASLETSRERVPRDVGGHPNTPAAGCSRLAQSPCGGLGRPEAYGVGDKGPNREARARADDDITVVAPRDDLTKNATTPVRAQRYPPCGR